MSALQAHQVMGRVGKSWPSPAASKPQPAQSANNPATARILRPQTNGYQFLMPQLAGITPQYIQMVLLSASQGNHVQQAALFRLMLDTWPELAACFQEIVFGVIRKKLLVQPWHEDDEQPDEIAVEKARLASAALRNFRPDAAADENGFDATVRDLAFGWLAGISVLECGWQQVRTPKLGQFWAPRATWTADPSSYGMAPDGRIGLNANALASDAQGISLQPQRAAIVPFPEHRFLVGINKGQPGIPFGSAILRALAWWWCALNYSADWKLNYAQIFGLPFRWANYDPNAPQQTIDAICNMLQNMGSAGWAAFPAGTTLELKEAGKDGPGSPQDSMMDRADRYVRLLLLGQTQSGGKGASLGGQAFGKIEKDVKEDRIEACAKYVAAVLRDQIVRSVLLLNYNEDSELPEVSFLEETTGTLEDAQKIQILCASGLKIGVNGVRKLFDLTEPAKDEETIGGAQPAQEKPPGEPKPKDNEDDALDAKALAARLLKIEDDALFTKALRGAGALHRRKGNHS